MRDAMTADLTRQIQAKSSTATPTIPVTQYPLICEPGGLRRCF